jgi:hypothetical protein
MQMLMPLVVKDNGIVKIKQVTIIVEKLWLHMHSAVRTTEKKNENFKILSDLPSYLK